MSSSRLSHVFMLTSDLDAQRRAQPSDDLELTIQLADVDAIYERLLAAGFTVEGPPEMQEWGARHMWFRDVDSRRMSVYT